jgi:hypothetical protein
LCGAAADATKDNTVAKGDGQWCCVDPTPTPAGFFPLIVDNAFEKALGTGTLAR